MSKNFGYAPQPQAFFKSIWKGVKKVARAVANIVANTIGGTLHHGYNGIYGSFKRETGSEFQEKVGAAAVGMVKCVFLGSILSLGRGVFNIFSCGSFDIRCLSQGIYTNECIQ